MTRYHGGRKAWRHGDQWKGREEGRGTLHPSYSSSRPETITEGGSGRKEVPPPPSCKLEVVRGTWHAVEEGISQGR